MDYLQQLQQLRYKDSLESFFKAAWKVIEPETTLIWNWHLTYLCGQLEEILHQVASGQRRKHDTIINVPPSTSKSTLITVVFPVWCWLHAPHLKFLTMSYAADLAIIHAVKSRDIIQSDWFQGLFSDIFVLKFDVNKKSEYANTKGGSRVAIGVGGGATGKHGDILLCDDPINPKKAAKLQQLEVVNSWWDNTIVNRMTNPKVTQKIIIMQRLAKKDLTGHCLAKGNGMYRHICLPAENTKAVYPAELAQHYTNGLLDANRLDADVLRVLRINLGSNNFAGQYLQEPVAAEGNLIKPEWFRTFTLGKLQDRVLNDRGALVWHMYVDGAYTEKLINCPTALLVAAAYGYDLFIREAARVWMELPELIRYIPAMAVRNGFTEASKVYIEPKASGLSAAQMLRRETPLNVIEDAAPREGKVERLKARLPFIESGRCYLLEDGHWVPMFLDETKAFPFGEYADITDTLTMATSRVDTPHESSSILDMASI